MSTSNDTFTTPFDFTFEKVIITADRFDFEVNLTYMISEINMFEHVDKPYLTGTILFNDNANLYNEINWLGTEKVEITIKTDDKLADHQITKKFIGRRHPGLRCHRRPHGPNQGAHPPGQAGGRSRSGGCTEQVRHGRRRGNPRARRNGNP